MGLLDVTIREIAGFKGRSFVNLGKFRAGKQNHVVWIRALCIPTRMMDVSVARITLHYRVGEAMSFV
jgi:hypothetical protein